MEIKCLLAGVQINSPLCIQSHSHTHTHASVNPDVHQLRITRPVHAYSTKRNRDSRSITDVMTRFSPYLPNNVKETMQYTHLCFA